jgi:hypothetical protein
MIYAQYINGEIVNYPCSLEYLVTLEILANATPTEEELVKANVITIKSITIMPPTDGHKYATRPVLQTDQTWQEEWVAFTTIDEQQAGVEIHVQRMITERNIRLGYTDWVVTKSLELDAPVPQAWKDYRQALRDLPLQPGFPFNIQWPQPPNR